MALKNQEGISEFGKRLYMMMERYNNTADDVRKVSSPKDLAIAFYNNGLVHVNTRENFNDPSRDKWNAINSIEKKIVRHIKTGVISDKQGEYLLAYASFFDCSTDYLLGLTPIVSSDIEVRRICELLGLSEMVVVELLKCRQNDDVAVAGCWSLLMESSLLHSIPNDIVSMGKEMQLMYQVEGELKAYQWKREKVTGPDLMDINLDIEGKQNEMDSKRSAFYGLLSKVSRNVEERIEAHLYQTYAPFRSEFAKAMMEEARKRLSK